MRKRQYATLQEYMERTGTNARRLIERLHTQTGRQISPAMFSMILRGSRRCSQWNAYALNAITGVPIEELTRWPRSTNHDNSRSAA